MGDIIFVGLDVHKATVSVAVAEDGRGGEVRQVGVFESRPEIWGPPRTSRFRPECDSLTIIGLEAGQCGARLGSSTMTSG
jgi:hypothetical protein